MRLSIIIPAHNEEKRIGPMLEAYLPFFFNHYGDQVEFLVVINGSTDSTDEVVASYAKRFPGVKMIVEPDRIGKGGAVMVGFREARGDLIGFVDADGATPPAAFQDLVDNLGDKGSIIASRWARGAKVSPPQPLDRRVASRVFNFLARWLFGLKLTDTQCGAKLMTKESVGAILPHLGITQWAFDVDLLFQLRRAGYSVKEIPTTWHDVEGSKIEVGKASPEMLMAMVRLRLIYSPFKWVINFYDRVLGPWIHPVGAVRDHLLTHSLVLFIGAQFGNICNLIFQVIMTRMLGNAEYGVMAAVLSALMILSTPLSAVGGGVTHFTALFMAKEEREKIKGMMAALARDLVLPVLLLGAIMMLGRNEIMRSFKIDSVGPIYIAIATVILMMLGMLSNSVLAGMQAFKWAALTSNAGAVLRLLFGVVLALFGLGAIGGLTAHMLGILVAGLFGLIVCGSLLGRKRFSVARPAGVYSYMGGYMVAFTAYGVLSGADMLLVKYYFSPEQAGVFSKAAMFARMVLFLPGPVCSAMFPKVTSDGESSQATRRTLLKAMAVTGLIMGSVALVCIIFPRLLLSVITKEIQPVQIEILRGMALAMAPLTLVAVLLNFELAQRRFKIMIPLFLCAGGYLLGVWYWHETLMQVVYVLGIMALVALGLSLVFTQNSYKKRV